MATPPSAPGPVSAPSGGGSYKVITHVFAGIATALAAFAVTPAGMALVKQYPYLAALFAMATAAAVYHQPTQD
jgi:hypothetical protein